MTFNQIIRCRRVTEDSNFEGAPSPLSQLAAEASRLDEFRAIRICSSFISAFSQEVCGLVIREDHNRCFGFVGEVAVLGGSGRVVRSF